MNINFFVKAEIEESIRRIEELLQSGIFLHENERSPFVRSALIEVLVCLRDLMFKTKTYGGGEINFADDVVKIEYQTKDGVEKIKNISDVIKYVRDALCHLDSNNHYLQAGSIRAGHNIIYGKGKLINIDGKQQTSDYEDDVCFLFGVQRIYLKRHIIRAFQEAKEKLLPFLQKI